MKFLLVISQTRTCKEQKGQAKDETKRKEEESHVQTEICQEVFQKEGSTAQNYAKEKTELNAQIKPVHLPLEAKFFGGWVEETQLV